MNEIIAIIITAIFVNNIILTKFLGICPFIGVSRRTTSAFGMGWAVIFVMTLSSIITWIIYYYLLIPFDVEYLQTVVFILVIASLVQLVELFAKKHLPLLAKSFGIYLPLITTNCAILGVAFLNITEEYKFINMLLYSFFTGVGFLAALLIMSGIRERLDIADVPEPFKGVPIAFIVAALLSLVFIGLV